MLCRKPCPYMFKAYQTIWLSFKSIKGWTNLLTEPTVNRIIPSHIVGQGNAEMLGRSQGLLSA